MSPRTRASTTAVKIVLTDVGKKAMDDIRETIRALVQQEGDLLTANRADVYFWDRVNLIVGGVGGTIVLIALIIAVFLTQRSVSQLRASPSAVSASRPGCCRGPSTMCATGWRRSMPAGA